MSERTIIGVNESENLFPDNTNSTINAADPVERTITGVNSSIFIIDNSEFELNPSAGGGFSIDEEEAGNDIVNGRLNENADGYILSQPNWSWVDGAIQYNGTGESYFGIQKTRVGAADMSSLSQILRFEVLEGEFFTDSNAIDSNMIVTPGTYGVGVHEINPFQMLNFGAGQPTIYIKSSTTGSRIDNIFLQPV